MGTYSRIVTKSSRFPLIIASAVLIGGTLSDKAIAESKRFELGWTISRTGNAASVSDSDSDFAYYHESVLDFYGRKFIEQDSSNFTWVIDGGIQHGIGFSNRRVGEADTNTDEISVNTDFDIGLGFALAKQRDLLPDGPSKWIYGSSLRVKNSDERGPVNYLSVTGVKNSPKPSDKAADQEKSYDYKLALEVIAEERRASNRRTSLEVDATLRWGELGTYDGCGKYKRHVEFVPSARYDMIDGGGGNNEFSLGARFGGTSRWQDSNVFLTTTAGYEKTKSDSGVDKEDVYAEFGIRLIWDTLKPSCSKDSSLVLSSDQVLRPDHVDFILEGVVENLKEISQIEGFIDPKGDDENKFDSIIDLFSGSDHFINGKESSITLSVLKSKILDSLQQSREQISLTDPQFYFLSAEIRSTIQYQVLNFGSRGGNYNPRPRRPTRL